MLFQGIVPDVVTPPPSSQGVSKPDSVGTCVTTETTEPRIVSAGSTRGTAKQGWFTVVITIGIGEPGFVITKLNRWYCLVG